MKQSNTSIRPHLTPATTKKMNNNKKVFMSFTNSVMFNNKMELLDVLEILGVPVTYSWYDLIAAGAKIIKYLLKLS